MPYDPFDGTGRSEHAYFTGAAEVTPSDTVDLAVVSRTLLVPNAGMIKVTLLDGQTVTIKTEGTYFLPLRVTRVWAGGTTCNGIVAVW
jgi:hypothetical protein